MKASLKTLAAGAAFAVAGVAAEAATVSVVTFDLDAPNAILTSVTAEEDSVLTFEFFTGEASVSITGTGVFYSETLAVATTETFFLEDGETYTYLVTALSDDATGSFTIVESTVTGAEVPLPAGLPLMLGALGVAGYVGRRRKAA